MKEFKVLNRSCQSTYLSLLIYDLNNNLMKQGEKCAHDLVNKIFSGIHSIVLNNFLDNIEYILEEMWFVKGIGEMLGLDIDNDIPERIQELCDKGDMHAVVKHFMPHDFLYVECRFMTEEEKETRNIKLNKIAEEIIQEMKQKGEI